MTRCFIPVLFASLLSSASLAVAQDPAPPTSGEMRSLFNGENLDGWSGDPKLWSVKDGVIRGETTAENPTKGNTFLICSQAETGDFMLHVSFRASSTNNSGIQYRSTHLTEGNASNPWVVRGYQHEIRNEVDMPNVSGFIYDEKGGRGRLCLVGEKVVWTEEGKQVLADDLISQEEFRQLFNLDDWNEAVIVAKGNNVRHYLNGRLVVDFTDEHPERALEDGILALQLHGGAPMWVEFKDIRIGELE